MCVPEDETERRRKKGRSCGQSCGVERTLDSVRFHVNIGIELYRVRIVSVHKSYSIQKGIRKNLYIYLTASLNLNMLTG
jgi:hypothetical protein